LSTIQQLYHAKVKKRSLVLNEQKGSRRAGAYDEESRKKWQDPDAVLIEIDLKPGATFIDIGCGEGFFTLPAARLVGEKGRVYGLDVSPQAIERLRIKAANEDITNLQLRVGRGEETVLCEACADFVFFGIVLHDFDEPIKVLANAAKMLKPGGELVNLDWKKEPMKLGPPVHIRFTEEKAIKLIEAGGFEVKIVKNFGLYHYLIIAGI
jgi:ubiquinone/menaquinone biosynthesis C-methylase UbiE